MLTFVGLCAAVLTSGAWIPQVWRAWTTKSTGDLAWGYVAAFGIGTILWVAYGVGVASVPIVAANIFAGAMLAALAILKVKFG